MSETTHEIPSLQCSCHISTWKAVSSARHTISKPADRKWEQHLRRCWNIHGQCVRYLSDRRFDEIRTQINSDPVLKSILNHVKYGWPSKESAIYPGEKPYFSSRNELSVNDDILFYRDRIIIPEATRSEILETIHSGHLGLNKCLERAKLGVWWPGVTRDIGNCVKDCEFCNIHRPKQHSEPLKSTALPQRHGNV